VKAATTASMAEYVLMSDKAGCLRMKKKLMITCVGIALLGGIVAVKTPVFAQDSAYPGFVLPQDQNAANKKATEERPGYRGLIPGWLPGRRTGQEPEALPDKTTRHQDTKPDTPQDRTASRFGPRQTPVPGAGAKPVIPATPEMKAARNPYTIERLKLLSMTRNEGAFTIEDSVLDQVSLPPFVVEALSKPSPPRKDGMTAAEHLTRIEIAKAMNVLKEARSAKERRETAAIVDDFFESLIGRYQSERDIPQRVKEKVGMPRSYIERRNKELEGAIKLVEAARKDLRSQL